MTKQNIKICGTCYVGRNAKETDYVLLLFKSDTNRSPFRMVGPIIHIPREKMQKEGLAIIVHHLRGGPNLDCFPLSFNDDATKKELYKIKRSYVLADVTILLDLVEKMEIIPLHAGHGWQFDANPEEVRIFPLPQTNNEFMKLLGEALELAS